MFPYEWSLKNTVFTKDKGNVFSCFACGGGSTMGYKLAGFNVLGCNEIDARMMAVYRKNHAPQFSFEESITVFKNKKTLPKELFDLDILDGSPPCSSFSMSGNREKDWGKEKKFTEGQTMQVLDTLFFDFIDLGKRLQPKIIVAENVTGLLKGNAKEYVTKIHCAFDKAGYCSQHIVLDASKMGVPQRRERIFFIALRKDLLIKIKNYNGLFNLAPYIDLKFNEPGIVFSKVHNKNPTINKFNKLAPSEKIRWDLKKPGDRSLADCDGRLRNKNSFFNQKFIYTHKIAPTIIATKTGRSILFDEPRKLDKLELCRVGSYPVDYDFMDFNPGYLIGMSVPPVMIAQLSTKIYEQWLNILK